MNRLWKLGALVAQSTARNGMLKAYGFSFQQPLIAMQFGRVRPPKVMKDRERKKSLAFSDEKAAKLSKAEEDAEAKKKKVDQEKLKAERAKMKSTPIKSQIAEFEQKPTRKTILRLRKEMAMETGETPKLKFNAERKMLKKKRLGRSASAKPVQTDEAKALAQAEKRSRTPNTPRTTEKPQLQHKVVKEYGNTEHAVNKELVKKLTLINTPPPNSKRTGYSSFPLQ